MREHHKHRKAQQWSVEKRVGGLFQVHCPQLLCWRESSAPLLMQGSMSFKKSGFTCCLFSEKIYQRIHTVAPFYQVFYEIMDTPGEVGEIRWL